MRVVIDTNVMGSALLNSSGLPAQILNLALNSSVAFLYSNPILDEYSRVLNREKFSFTPELIDPLLDFLRFEGELVVSEPSPEIFTDKDDKKFYEVLISGTGDYLITGNLKHFPHDSRIVSPGKFIEIFTA